ncbi:MAG: hypothetical protein Fur0022_17830 [Anaerolineales bacterium]
MEHLQTRKRHGHLAQSATLADYHAIISLVVSSELAQLYIYHWRDDLYPTIIAPHEGKIWLVMFNTEGILETAFPPTDPDGYLAEQRFSPYGLLTEL